MSEIPKTYEPASIEEKWYAHWLADGCFTADPARVSEKRPAYSIVIPPPNVTGVLHARARAEQHHPGHPRPPRAHARQGSALAARHRSRRHRHAERGGEDAAAKQGEIKHRDDLGREELVGEDLGVEGEVRRHHHPAAQEARRFVRLVARSASRWTRTTRAASRASSWTSTRRA